jgi:hypothetical protein
MRSRGTDPEAEAEIFGRYRWRRESRVVLFRKWRRENKNEPGKVISTIGAQADGKHLANPNDETGVHCRQIKP